MTGKQSRPSRRGGGGPTGEFSVPPTATNPVLLADGSDSEFRQMMQNLLIMAHQVEQLRAGLARNLGLTHPQYRIFLAVAQLQKKRGVSVSAVARHLRLTGAFVTREVGKLVRRGYLSKQEDPDDGRGVRLSLTREGEDACRNFAPVAQAINDELFREISRSEFKALSRILCSLVSGGERALLVAEVLRLTGARAVDVETIARDDRPTLNATRRSDRPTMDRG